MHTDCFLTSPASSLSWRQQPFALCLFAFGLASPANCLRLLTRPLFRWLLVSPSSPEFAKNALALHLLFQYAQRLIDIVVPYEYLQGIFLSLVREDRTGNQMRGRQAHQRLCGGENGAIQMAQSKKAPNRKECDESSNDLTLNLQHCESQ